MTKNVCCIKCNEPRDWRRKVDIEGVQLEIGNYNVYAEVKGDLVCSRCNGLDKKIRVLYQTPVEHDCDILVEGGQYRLAPVDVQHDYTHAPTLMLMAKDSGSQHYRFKYAILLICRGCGEHFEVHIVHSSSTREVEGLVLGPI